MCKGKTWLIVGPTTSIELEEELSLGVWSGDFAAIKDGSTLCGKRSADHVPGRNDSRTGAAESVKSPA